MELTAGYGIVKSLWIKIKGQRENEDEGVYYRPPSQNANADELFEEQRDTSMSTALVLMGDFSLPKIIWERHPGHKIPKKTCMTGLKGACGGRFLNLLLIMEWIT